MVSPYQQYRTYNVEIGVSDGSALWKTAKKISGQARCASLNYQTQDIHYEIYSYPSNDADAPDCHADGWKLFAESGLELNTPCSRGLFLAIPRRHDGLQWLHPATHPIRYNDTLTVCRTAARRQPLTALEFYGGIEPRQAGWYKLCISSETSRILGLSGDRWVPGRDEATVNIGNEPGASSKPKSISMFAELRLYSIGQDFYRRTKPQQNDTDPTLMMLVKIQLILENNERPKTFLHSYRREDSCSC